MINEETLTEIEGFAQCYLSKSEIALITGISIDEFKDEASSAFGAFQKGRLLRKSQFNRAVMRLCDQLSSPAMLIEVKLAEKAQLNDI